MRSAAAFALVLLAGCEKKPDSTPEAGAEPPSAMIEPENAKPSTSPAATPTAATPRPVRMQALGTEPFWAVEVLPGTLRYTTPELPDGQTLLSTSAPEGKGVRYSGKLDGKPLSLLIEPGKCSDGMSDTVYDWKAVLTIDGKAEQGCARTR
jgi:uncharacterized membrane protein